MARQVFIDSQDCDEGPRVFTTTDGHKQKVALEMCADDGTCHIKLRTKGEFTLRVGYYYTVDNGSRTAARQLKVYHTQSKILQKKTGKKAETGDNDGAEDDTLSIPNGRNADVVVGELSPEEKGCCFPLTIDILHLSGAVAEQYEKEGTPP